VASSRDWSAGFPAEVDWPQTERKDPPGFHEAIWTWGYDPAARVGYYLYLLHDLEDETLRNESIVVYLPDGRILRGAGRGRNSAGRVAAGDGLAVECIEPFRHWETRYQGTLVPVAWNDPAPIGDRVQVSLRFSMRAGAPAWNVEGDWGEAPPNMRYHQLYRVTDGELAMGADRVSFGGTAMRGHSRRERDLSKYRGHVIATALYDDGRAFGMFAFFGSGTEFERPHGYVVLDGQRHEAIVEEATPITRPRREGEKLRFVLRGDFGRLQIAGETITTTFTLRTQGPQAGLATSSGIARYDWGDGVAYGPIDRWHTADVLVRG
jgi:hypothetical protein